VEVIEPKAMREKTIRDLKIALGKYGRGSRNKEQG
jgi:hypothetical protein